MSRVHDVFDDVLTGLARRPGRTVLYAMGAAIAAALFSYSTVVSTTSAMDVAATFDELAATRLRVDLPLANETYATLHPDLLDAVSRIEGVEGVLLLGRATARLTTLRDPARDLDEQVDRYTAVGALAVLDAALVGSDLPTGSLYVGGGLATEHDLRRHVRVELDGRPARIAGRIDRAPDATDVLFGVVETAPAEVARDVGRGVLLVEVRRGWAEEIAPRLAAVLNPNHPGSVLVRYPPEAARLRAAVVGRVDALVLVVAVSLLVLSGLVVGVATFASVVQNQRLIGMRMAIGASAGDIAYALLLEIVLTAGLGATVGTLAGTAAATVVSAGEGPAVAVPAGWLLGGIGAAVAMNALAGLPPTLHAVRIDPARAIQSR